MLMLYLYIFTSQSYTSARQGGGIAAGMVQIHDRRYDSPERIQHNHVAIHKSIFFFYQQCTLRGDIPLPSPFIEDVPICLLHVDLKCPPYHSARERLISCQTLPPLVPIHCVSYKGTHVPYNPLPIQQPFSVVFFYCSRQLC